MKLVHMKSNSQVSNAYHKGEVRVPSIKMNHIVNLFTMSPRHWTAYSADRIEVIARWHGVIPQNAMYKTFDAEKEELVFTIPVYVDDPYEGHVPWWKRMYRRWKLRRFMKVFETARKM